MTHEDSERTTPWSSSQDTSRSTLSITADLLDPGRVILFEHRESQAAVEMFRRSAPRNKHRTAMLSVSVAEYDVAYVPPVFGKGRA